MGIDLGRLRSKSNDEWVDWLSDDPVPESIRQLMGNNKQANREVSRTVVRRPGRVLSTHLAPVPNANHQAAAGEPAAADTTKTVNIHISLPKLKFKRPKLPTLPAKLSYKRLGIAAGALCFMLAVGGFAVVSRSRGNEQSGPTTGVLSSADQKPTFEYSLPTGAGHEVRSEDVRYVSNRQVVNFKDSIGGVPITISQQPLPDKFKKNTADEVKKLAEGFSATKVLSTANPTAYLGTSAKGPQTVIFAKKDLLVFIQSTKEIDDHDWAEYITNLQ